MSMRNFFIALAITAVFLGILLLAGTAQNEGCLPWKDAGHRRRRRHVLETPGTKLCK